MARTLLNTVVMDIIGANTTKSTTKSNKVTKLATKTVASKVVSAKTVATKPASQKISSAVARRNAYATKHHGLVEKVARRLVRRLPSHIELDELISAGMLGLLEASERFDPDRGEKFESFAEFRIRGAMLDELRSRDSLSRDMRRVSTELKRATADLMNQLGREPSEVEVASHLGVGVQEVRARRTKLAGWSVVGFDDAGPAFLEQTADDSIADPCEAASRAEFVDQLVEHIEMLPEKMRQVLSLYYCEDLNLKEIGHVLGVTESRVCQIHGEATKRLRAVLGNAYLEQAA